MSLVDVGTLIDQWQTTLVASTTCTKISFFPILIYPLSLSSVFQNSFMKLAETSKHSVA